MAPKRRRRKTVVTTRKVVEETLKVVVVDAPEEETGDTYSTEKHENIRTIPVQETPPPEPEQRHETPPASKPDTRESVTPEEQVIQEISPVLAQETTMEIGIPKVTASSAPETISGLAVEEPQTVAETRTKTIGLPHKRRHMKKSGSRKGRESKGLGYKRYLLKVMKQVHPEMGISQMAMTVINNMMSDVFERLAQSAVDVQRHAGMRTMSYREVEAAVKLVLPGDLGRHALSEASKAIRNYIAYESVQS